MVNDRPDETEPLPDSERPKRAPPTIDLEATEISSETSHAAEPAAPEEPVAEPAPAAPVSPPRPVSPWIIAPIAGAVAAALVIVVGWMLGWPAVQPVAQPTATPSAPQLNAAAIDGLAARIAGVETKIGKPVTADPATATRIDGLEKSLAALRGDLAANRAQDEKLASAINEAKSAPASGGAASPDLSAVDQRIAKVESAMQAQSAEIAQQGSKIADAREAEAKATEQRAAEAKAAEARPADDVPLRRVVAAALLDVLVRTGDPYPAALAAAKALAPNADALKPLDEFAAGGVPNANKLSTELLRLVPKLLPALSAASTTGSGIVEKLQAGAAKLVRIERTDTVGNDRGAVVARITAAALRNDSNEARRELKSLEPADRAAAQGWLDKADARDAALAASRQFAADAMAVLAKPAQ